MYTKFDLDTDYDLRTHFNLPSTHSKALCLFQKYLA